MSIVIDGTTYNVPVVSLVEDGDFLFKYAQRTADGHLKAELIGVFRNYSLQFGNHASTTELAALWVKLIEAQVEHTVTVPDADGAPITFTAYFANVHREILKDTAAKTFWKNLTVKFIATIPAVTP
jgi:hypothetical protein